MVNLTWNIYNFRLNILRRLTEEGYKIYVIAPIDKYIVYKKEFPALTHIPLYKLKRKNTNPFTELLLIRELYKIYRKIKPDIILHYTVKPNIYGGIVAGILKIPSLAVVTGLGYAFIHKGILKQITVLLYRFSSQFHKKIVFENKDDLELFKELKMIKAHQGLSVKGCGIDTEQFKPLVNYEEHKFVITFIGRLIYDKGIKEFVDAASLVKKTRPEVIFWIIGEIDKENPAAIHEEELAQWSQEKIVIYQGAKDDIRESIINSDCIVLPSYREGLPKVLLESMSMAKPIITTDSPGCREAVEHGVNGYLVPVRSVTGLAETMTKVIDMNPEDRDQMGKNGRQKAQREFEGRLIAEQFSNLIHNTLN